MTHKECAGDEVYDHVFDVKRLLLSKTVRLQLMRSNPSCLIRFISRQTGAKNFGNTFGKHSCNIYGGNNHRMFRGTDVQIDSNTPTSMDKHDSIQIHRYSKYAKNCLDKMIAYKA